MTKKLTNKEILALKELGRHSLGDNLFIRIRTTKAGKLSRAFEFKWVKDGEERTRGFGSILRVSPARARLKAARARLSLDEGVDPFPPKQVPQRAPETLRTHAMAFIESNGASWGPKHRSQWHKAVDGYLAPIANLPIAAIDTPAIEACMRPLWDRIQPTAEKTRGMLEQILASATTLGLRSGPNPATRENLSTIFKKKKGEQRHHCAMDYADVPDFLADLRRNPSIAALALEFCVLTASRTAETRLARWDEIDLAGKTWTIGAHRMKSGREHKVPLAGRCCAILESLLPRRSGDYVFPGSKPNAPLGKMAMAELTPSPSTVHGFRSSFRDFAGEETKHPGEIAEFALAHVSKSATIRAYRRKTAFLHRIELMAEWASFCEHGSKKVVPIRA